MWYWTLPSLALTGVCLLLPNYIYAGLNYLDTKHFNRRNYDVDYRDYYLYMRDRRISGNEYVTRGIENVDKPLDLSGLKGWIFTEKMAVPFSK